MSFINFCNNVLQLNNTTIGLTFWIEKQVFSENLPTQLWDSNKFDFNGCIEQLELQMKLNAIKEKFKLRNFSKDFKFFSEKLN